MIRAYHEAAGVVDLLDWSPASSPFADTSPACPILALVHLLETLAPCQRELQEMDLSQSVAWVVSYTLHYIASRILFRTERCQINQRCVGWTKSQDAFELLSSAFSVVEGRSSHRIGFALA